jgi:hypothetical protein
MLNSIKVIKASTHLFVITASQARLAVVGFLPKNAKTENSGK